ncbi:hypothetical protein CPA41_22980 [Klebsiella pneumoniae subsp. pneumoniae]|uniref:hypothetical protein n=1 Tax=Klebsiella pneumoniae TaxID=573 RepID=UPI0015E1FFBF|nr:hypothetical protein [Klebsiella pneumoniae]MBA0894713.1 hypothetical protein [Klebsiella pneumoniae subsp. pneumoniae]
MTITLQAVNELIASLESAGELSIRERKYLELAKEFRICSTSLDAVIRTGNALADQNAQLAAENVQIKAMNDCLSEELRGYESDGTFDGPKMHLLWWQVETPATDAYLAGIKADGVDEFAESQKEYVRQHRNEMDQVLRAAYAGSAVDAERFAKQLREGADK